MTTNIDSDSAVTVGALGEGLVSNAGAQCSEKNEIGSDIKKISATTEWYKQAWVKYTANSVYICLSLSTVTRLSLRVSLQRETQQSWHTCLGKSSSLTPTVTYQWKLRQEGLGRLFTSAIANQIQFELEGPRALQQSAVDRDDCIEPPSAFNLRVDRNLWKTKLKRFLFRNVMTDFPTILFDLVQNMFSVRFSYLHRLNNLSQGLRNMPKFPCCRSATR